MKLLAMFGASAIMLVGGIAFAQLAVSQGDLGYAAGASVSGLLGLGFIGAALKGLNSRN
ncbi:hypothetical protein [Burkholderia vietnamiensis]|uniref:hypothetical protein n=1 Tax=Burkholderia vietnamiensis TaxID=60552 RepID=UPI0015943B89|nr:hypothetical protein [Burkholderia vietnamiensis]MCA8270413.1 hypothetical protein [Burkholderia vietnamiensis]